MVARALSSVDRAIDVSAARFRVEAVAAALGLVEQDVHQRGDPAVHVDPGPGTVGQYPGLVLRPVHRPAGTPALRLRADRVVTRGEPHRAPPPARAGRRLRRRRRRARAAPAANRPNWPGAVRRRYRCQSWLLSLLRKNGNPSPERMESERIAVNCRVVSGTQGIWARSRAPAPFRSARSDG